MFLTDVIWVDRCQMHICVCRRFFAQISRPAAVAGWCWPRRIRSMRWPRWTPNHRSWSKVLTLCLMGFDASMTFRDCPWCGLTHAQMTPTQTAHQASPPGRSPRWWSTLVCPACGGMVLVETNTPQTSQHQILGVFPAVDTANTEVSSLPEDVRGYYTDAIKVLRAGVPDAAAVQLRRTLEAAAAHYEVAERTLVKSIEKLIDAGHVTKSFGDALHHIRLVGNLGAHHTDERVDDERARRALRFTTALLRNLFEVPAELAALQAEEPPPKVSDPAT
jgi:hypothetical protein